VCLAAPTEPVITLLAVATVALHCDRDKLRDPGPTKECR